MAIDLSNFTNSNQSLFDIAIVQRGVDGGVSERSDIERIAEYPNAKSLMISGLNQETFEYLIYRFGAQFEAISFWKNKMVSDLSPLSGLRNLKYVHYFFNQRAVKLWDMKENENLTGLAVYDFSRLHSIAEVAAAPNLEYFSIGNRVWSRMEIESLKPLIGSTVRHFEWCGEKVLDNDFMCLTKSNIRELDLNISRFKMDELARLVAGFPDLKGSATMPYWEMGYVQEGKRTTFYFLCKGKRRLTKGKDEEKLEKYLKDFQGLVAKYRGEAEP